MRADYIVPGSYIVDVKTTSMPAGADYFAEAVDMFQYGLSAAFYCQIAYQHYGSIHEFYWIVFSRRDMQCDVYKASSSTLSEGTADYTRALVTYNKCKKSGIWVVDNPTDLGQSGYVIEEI
jgi:hypothetical protein